MKKNSSLIKNSMQGIRLLISYLGKQNQLHVASVTSAREESLSIQRSPSIRYMPYLNARSLETLKISY
ncbi:MAG: hypothetical protein ABI045_04885 [Flavobacteriales bacterium]